MQIRAIALFAALLALPCGGALAQTNVVTQPFNAVSSNASGTIAVTDTFQSIWPADTRTTGRVSCAVQNKSASDPMWVFFGPLASASKAASVLLGPGVLVNCAVFGIVLRDQVSITGTSGDEFFAAMQ